MTDREFISEVLRISETVFDAHIQSDEIDNLCHQYKTELAVAPVNTAQQAKCATESRGSDQYHGPEHNPRW